MPLEQPSYPVALVLSGRPCLVVGGGVAATRRIEALLACGAIVTVIAPKISPVISALPVEIVLRRYRAGEAAKYQLVFAATGIADVDRQIFADAENAKIFVNANDNLADSSFLLPALVRRGPIAVAVSTDGTSPALAGYVRDRVDILLTEDLVALAPSLVKARTALHETGSSTEGHDWRGLIEELLRAFAEGEDAQTHEIVERFVATALAKRTNVATAPTRQGDLGADE